MAEDGPVAHAMPERWRDRALALVLGLFTLGCAWMQASLTPVGAPPDEWAHITYVHEIAVDGRLIPDYEGSRILPVRRTANYLGHPPLYYSGAGLAGRMAGWPDPAERVLPYRMFSAVLVAIGIGLWVLTGRTLGLSSTLLVAAVAATNAIPMFPYLAGSLNNDNLGYLAVALAFYGVVRLDAWPRGGYYVAAAGLLAALLTKATAAVFLLAFLACWLALLIRREGRVPQHRHLFGAMALAAVLAAAWYLPVLAQYGTPFPRSGQLRAGLPPPADPLGLPALLTQFIVQMWGRLPEIASHASLVPLAGPLSHAVHALLLLPLLAWGASHLSAAERRRHDSMLGTAFIGASIIMLAIHFFMFRQSYHTHGVLSGLQPRYYSFLLPGLFIIGLLAHRRSRLVALLAVAFSLVAALLLSVSPARSVQAQMMMHDAPPPTRLSLRHRSPSPARAISMRTGAGYVDEIAVGPDSIRVRGWAIDADTRAPAGRVWIFLDRQSIGPVSTGGTRTDVASALASLDAMRSGYAAVIETGHRRIDVCRLTIAAEQADGSLVALANDKCAER
jgi:hypothetical protein